MKFLKENPVVALVIGFVAGALFVNIIARF